MTYRGLEDNDNDEGSRIRTEDPESLQTQPEMLAMKATLTTLRVLKTWLEPGGARTLTPPPKAAKPHAAALTFACTRRSSHMNTQSLLVPTDSP